MRVFFIAWPFAELAFTMYVAGGLCLLVAGMIQTCTAQLPTEASPTLSPNVEAIKRGPLEAEAQALLNDALGVTTMQDAFFKASQTSMDTINGDAAAKKLADRISKRFRSRTEVAERLSRAAQTAYTSGQTSLREDLCCKIKPGKAVFDARFNTTVLPSSGCDRISENASTTRPTISPAITKVAHSNLLKVPEVKFQYFGSEEGYTTIFPGFNTSDCSKYDPRYRPWYVAGAVPRPKDLVIVLDISSSMGQLVGTSRRTRLDLAKEAIFSILDALSPQDRVTVVPFNAAIIQITMESLLDCFNTRLGAATSYNIRKLKGLVSSLHDGGNTNYGKAITKAFEILQNSGASTSSGRDLVILFLSDGDPSDKKDTILAAQQRSAQQFSYAIPILTYALGDGLSPIGKDILRSMAQQSYTPALPGVTLGEFYEITDFLELRADLTRFYSFFVKQTLMGPHATSTVITTPYYDAFGLGVIQTIASPVYTGVGANTMLRGVVGVDITITDLFGDVSFFSKDEHQYAFMMDKTTGKAILHPLLQQPSDVSSDPVYPDIRLLEVGLDASTYSRLIMGSGSVTLNATRFINYGNSQYEGTNLKYVTSSYNWQPVANTSYVVCIVLNLEATHVADITQQDAPRDLSVYHRLDLSVLRGRQCNKFGRRVLADVTAVKFSPEAFLNPSHYLNVPEVRENVTAYLNYLDGSSGTPNNYFKEKVIDHVRLTSRLDSVWLSRTAQKNQTSIVWRYIGTIEGVFRILPGGELPTAYDHMTRGWFTRALNNPGKAMMSAPYLDAFGAGYVLTLSRSIRQSTDQSANTPVGAVMGMDFTMGFISNILNKHYNCAVLRCFLMDTSGYLLFHPSFLKGNYNPEWVHLGHEEPLILQDLLTTGYMEKKVCVRYDTFKQYATYRMNDTQVIRGFPTCTATLFHNMEYKLERLDNSNVYLGVFNDKGHKCFHNCERRCVSKNSLGECDTRVGEIQTHLCECPCTAPLQYQHCNDSFPAKVTKHDVCPPEVLSVHTSLRKSSNVSKLEQCFKGSCSSITTQPTCYATAGCSWCLLDEKYRILPKGYCTTDCQCFMGTRGKKNPTASCSGDAGGGSGKFMFQPIWTIGIFAAIFVVAAVWNWYWGGCGQGSDYVEAGDQHSGIGRMSLPAALAVAHMMNESSSQPPTPNVVCAMVAPAPGAYGPPGQVPGSYGPPGQVPGAYRPPSQVPGAYAPPGQVPGAYGPPGQVPGAYGPPGQVPGAYGPPGQVPGAYGPPGQVPGAYGPPGQVPGAYGPPGQAGMSRAPPRQPSDDEFSKPRDPSLQPRGTSAGTGGAVHEAPPDYNAAVTMPAVGAVDPRYAGPGGMDPRYAGPGGMDPRYPGPGGMDPRYPGPGGMDPRYPGPGGMDPRYPGPGGMDPRYPGPGGMDSRYPGPGGVAPHRPGPGGMGARSPQNTGTVRKV